MAVKKDEESTYVAKGTYFDRDLSDSDKAAVADYSRQWYEARDRGDQAGMDAAHSAAEAIRSGYDYSGGDDGSERIGLGGWIGGGKAGGESVSGSGAVGSWGGGQFSYNNAPSYVNRYQSQIDGLTSQILGRAAFEYDPENDPTYQQYKASYTRSGQRAMQDTLGQVSARTGGLASSYAGGAAQQTYDNYMSALADKIPELRQLAYSMYQDEGNTQRANLEMLMALEQGDYSKYQNLLSQYNTDRSFDYGIFRDSVGDQRYEDETAYNRENYASETEYNRALSKAQTMAAVGDFSGYKELGYSDDEIANLKIAWDAAQMLSRSSGRSGGGGSSGGSGKTGSDTQGGGIVETMLSFGDDNKAYEYLLGLKYSNSKSDTLWEMYQAAKESSGGGARYDFTAVQRSLNEQLSNGREERALAYIESFWDGLTNAQQRQVQSILARHGLEYNP